MKTPTTGTVTGTIYEAGATTPLSGVNIHIGQINTQSAHVGAYTLNGVPAGNGLTITADKDGYINYQGNIAITAGLTTIRDIYLNRVPPTAGTVRGIVTDSTTGWPVVGTRVTAQALDDFTDEPRSYSDAVEVAPGISTQHDFVMQREEPEPATGGLKGKVRDDDCNLVCLAEPRQPGSEMEEYFLAHVRRDEYWRRYIPLPQNTHSRPSQWASYLGRCWQCIKMLHRDRKSSGSISALDSKSLENPGFPFHLFS